MYLSELKIKGYKTFGEEFRLEFNKGLTILLGENGCGKTAAIDAIRLLLNEDEYGRIGISKTDFHRPLDRKAKDLSSPTIEIRGIFSDLAIEEQTVCLPWLDGQDKTRAYLNLLIENKENSKGRYNNRKLWGGTSISSIFEYEILEEKFHCIYLPPLRDASTKLESYRGSRLSRLLMNNKPKDGTEHPLQTRVAEFNQDLEKEQVIQDVSTNIRDYLKKSVGEFLGQDVSIQFSDTSFERIVEKLRLLFYPRMNSGIEDRELFREIVENSLGHNNILYLATVLAELEHVKDCFYKVLLIEELEAHLHPQLQVRLMKYLKAEAASSGIQIIISSHSANIASVVDINSINVMTIGDHGIPTSTLINSCNIEPTSKSFLERWVDVTRSALFFAKGVIFVEGISEALLIKELAKKRLEKLGRKGASLDDFGISIVELSGIHFNHFLALYKGYEIIDGKERSVAKIPVPCSVLTDCDPRRKAKPTLRAVCDCRNPQLRHASEVNAKSKNCKILSNLKTLEYDLALEGNNLRVMLSELKDWATPTGKIRSTVDQYLEIDWGTQNDAKKAEVAIWLLGKVEGCKNVKGQSLSKGEYALRLATRISSLDLKFSVPKYIEEAIDWVLPASVKDTKTSAEKIDV